MNWSQCKNVCLCNNLEMQIWFWLISKLPMINDKVNQFSDKQTVSSSKPYTVSWYHIWYIWDHAVVWIHWNENHQNSKLIKHIDQKWVIIGVDERESISRCLNHFMTHPHANCACITVYRVVANFYVTLSLMCMYGQELGDQIKISDEW